ncbi:MAG: CPBP family intramembrane glutamic endopeptidase [Rhodothermales bacterium]
MPRFTSSVRDRIQAEWNRARTAWKGLDAQTVTVLVVAAAAVILQDAVGSRRLFRSTFGSAFDVDVVGLLSWGWWFVIQGITGFVIPAAILLLVFRRSLREAGLAAGDVRFAVAVAAVYLPVVVLGTWFLSASEAFQAQYPHHPPAATDWGVFAIYEALFLFYWAGWEYLWRGFVLFGTRHTFGVYAIFIQAVPFALLHLDKPLPEAVLSLIGGIALGALVWRCRAFWIAVPIHAAQMMILDLWCTLRIRSGVDGVGWDALMNLLG